MWRDTTLYIGVNDHAMHVFSLTMQVNGQNLSQHPDLPYNVDRFTRSLILLNVTTDNVEDRTFRCIASNSAGTIASENFTVNVNG